eukprot:tig00020964_g16784.t1
MALVPQTLYGFDPLFDFFGLSPFGTQRGRGQPQLQGTTEQGLIPSWIGPVANVDWNPRVDLHESATDWTIKAELPGVKKEDINIDQDGDLLTLSGKTKEEKEEKKEGEYIRRERRYGSFMRQFRLPGLRDLPNDKIEAHYEHAG